MKKKDYLKPTIDVVALKPTKLLLGSGPGAGSQTDPTLINQSDPFFDDSIETLFGF